MDVIEIAKTRRSKLSRELAKLDEFIRLGEELCRTVPAETPATDAAKKEPTTLREFSGGATAAQKG